MDEQKTVVPVWTLGTNREDRLPALPETDSLTPARLSEMRAALAAFADSPVATLEAHPLSERIDRSQGITLDRMSPLAQELAKLVSHSAKSPAVADVGPSAEVLYKMVVPAKFADQVARGLVKPMVAKGAGNGIYGALRGPSGIVANARFVPVSAQSGAAAAGGAAGGAAGATAAGIGAAGALTVAAPLVLMAVAVGVSAYADKQRQEAIEHITELLEKLDAENLAKEQRELDGCRDAIDKATSVLLDEGAIGAALGLDSAVHAINVSIAGAHSRARNWAAALDEIEKDSAPVDVERLLAKFPELKDDGREFRAHLELANLAMTLKRRVIVLQAVQHSQSDPSNPFKSFTRSLQTDQKSVDELETSIRSVLLRLSAMHIQPPRRRMEALMTRGQVDRLLSLTYRLRELGAGVQGATTGNGVVIEIAKHRDGSLLVLPAATT